jgi:tetratricopeptide (TPR) repeat protein
MGLFDRFDVWKAKLGGDPEKVKGAEKKAHLARAEELEKRGALAEAVEALAAAEEFPRAARLALKSKDFARAGDLFIQARLPLDAARALEQAKDVARAAKHFEDGGDVASAERCFKQATKRLLMNFYVRRQRWGDAGRAAEEDGDVERASEHYEKAGDFDAAARVWRADKKILSAADMYRRHDKFLEAARIYEELNLPTKAVELYAKAGAHAEAARLYGHLAGMALATSKNAPPGAQVEALGLARKAAEHALAAGDATSAAQWFKKAGDPAKAAECLLRADPAKAAKAYEDAGDLESAAAAWEMAGDAGKAAFLRARVFDPAKAAALLAAEGKHAEAAELLLKLGKTREAAEAFGAAGRHGQAAELMLALKDLAGAAACYERAGLFSRAEPLYRQMGDDENLLRLLLKRNEHREAAKVLIRRKDYERAIQSLQKLPASPEASGLLAHCFRARGLVEQALLKYEEAVAGRKVSRDTLEVFYEYARALEEKKQDTRAGELYQSILAVDLDYGDVRERIERLRAHEPTRTLPSLPEHYEVRAELDRGGEAVVFLAHDKRLDRKVALKVLPLPEDGRAPHAEAKAIAGLSHPNIVTLYEIHEDARGVVLVLEYLEGETLRKRVDRDGPLPAAEAARVGREVAAALHYAHQRGLVHRDVKPANVMLLPGGAVKMLDFGMARSLENLEVSSTFCGTPMYMAPEQILCRRPDARTDVYGLGATLFFALTGRTPFQGEDVFYQHLHCEPAAPGTPLDAVLLRCLAKDPAARYASAAEVAAALEA